MQNVILISESITEKNSITIKNATQINIANLNNTVAEFFVNGRKRFIPAFDSVNGCPVGDFSIHDNGNVIQDIKIEFRSATYNLILDYFQLTDELINKCN